VENGVCRRVYVPRPQRVDCTLATYRQIHIGRRVSFVALDGPDCGRTTLGT
jgi:hypothetical protein